jgi:PAS domain S-box-containing protein
MAKKARSRRQPAWQEVDARVLGQILAAQGIVFTLPNTTRIAEFYAQAMLSVPGIIACRVCLGGKSVEAGEMTSSLCAECEVLRNSVEKDGTYISANSNLKCRLADQPDMRFIAIDSYEHHFGFLVFKINDAAVFEVYQPFTNNLSNYVATVLENRVQKDLLQAARTELERKVEERTHDLTAANEALTTSRRAALKTMQAAIEAHQCAERANAELQREVAERKEAEENLEKMNERFSLAARAARLGVWDWDIQKNLLVWDDRMYELYGVQREDFAGAYEAWLKGVHPDDRAPCDEISKQAQRREREYDTEFRVVWPDGSVHTLKAYGQVVRGADGKPLRMTGINYDITASKGAEEEIRRLNQELEQRVVERTAQLEAANKELEAFAYSVSHDLRAPLRHIDGFLELLRKRTATILDQQSQHYVATVSESAKQMGMLIDDLLSFSRMGRHEMSKMRVDLGGLLQEVIRHIEPEAKARTIHWQVADLPVVMGDRAMLRIVLINLVSNALKFTQPRERAEIEIGCMFDAGAETIIFVRDNGVGFDVNHADKLFGVFQRLHRVDEFEGTGIGLANVRRIINRHGGRTWAEGEVDHGATFYFSIPQLIQGA